MPPHDVAEPRLDLTREQRDVATALRSWLSTGWCTASAERGRPSHAAERQSHWRELCSRFDLVDAALPASKGGLSDSAADLAVIAEELGRALSPAPLQSMLARAIPMLASSTTPAAASILDRARSGELIAVAEISHDLTQSYASESGPIRLSGTIDGVLDADVASTILIQVPQDGSRQLLAVDLGDAEVQIISNPGLDLLRGHADVRLTSARATVVDSVFASSLPLAALSEVLLAAESVGVGARAVELAVEHATNRNQFGRPIGTFQAVKHRIARAFVAIEEARSMTREAASLIVMGTVSNAPARPSAGNVASPARMAALLAIDAARDAALGLIYVLGAMGVTWEHPAHRYYRRAHSNALLTQSQPDRLAAIAEEVLR